MTSTALLPASRTIQVSGNRDFAENRWREAILFYLFGIWADDTDVTYRPKISFGFVTLDLDPGTGRYYAYGLPSDRELPNIRSTDTLFVDETQTAVQEGLVRFVKNPRIRALAITFPSLQTFYLWKKGRRGEYGCWANVPRDFKDAR